MKNKWKKILAIALICNSSCSPIPVTLNNYTNNAPQYADSLNKFTKRYSGTQSILDAKDFICRTMQTTADTVEIQSHTTNLSQSSSITLHNIICKYYSNYKNRILIYSNYDQNPISADSTDCSSGTALLMSLAKYIANNDPGYGIDIVFFDGRYARIKDATINQHIRYCLGSQAWAKHNKEILKNYKYGISVTHPAHKQAVFVIDGNSNHFASRHFYFARSTAKKFDAEQLFPEIIARPYYGDNTIISAVAGVRSMCIAGQILKNGNPQDLKQDNIKEIDNQKFETIAKIILETIYTSH